MRLISRQHDFSRPCVSKSQTVLSEAQAATRLLCMDQVNRCESCGRKRPCNVCATLGIGATADRLLNELARERTTLLVWFDCAEPEQALNRLWSEWPYELDIVWPAEEGDLIGVNGDA